MTPCPLHPEHDVHIHDVTGVLAMEIDVTRLLSGREGEDDGSQPAVV